MANYPSIDIAEESALNPRSGIITDRASDGTIRSTRMASVTQFDPVLVHPRVTSAERTTLLDHYAAHVNVTFNWVAPWGETYTLRYVDAPQQQPHPGGYWTITNRLTGEKA